METDTRQTEKKSIWTTVTPLSRILALVLFIALPCIGFWVGYTYVPEKTIERERKSVESTTEKLLPVGYSLDKYRTEEVTSEACSKNTDCSLPVDYAIRSNCPYTSLCLENKCTVVCPTFE